MRTSKDIVLLALSSMPPVKYMEYGLMIGFGDIYEFCYQRGLDNKDIIVSVLEQLSLENHCEAVYGNELLLGVKC